MKRSLFSPTVHTLSNGLQVIIDSVPGVDSTAVGYWIKAGTRDEPRGKAGIAHLVEHTSFRRTRHRTTRKIARDFENVGAYANAYTTKEETCYYVRTLSDHLKPVLSTLTDVVVDPVFDPSDVDKERSIITEEIRSYEDEAEEYIFDLAEQQLFGRHPLGSPIVGTITSVGRMSVDDLVGFHHRHYHAGSAVLTISGSVDPNRFLDLAEHLTRDLPKAQRHRSRRSPHAQAPSQRAINWSSQQSHLLWHTATPGYHSSERAALTLLNVILGDGMSSRLNLRIREVSGIAYTIYSQLQLFTDVGMFAIYAGMDDRNISRSQRLIERELRKLREGGIRPSELKRAKEQVRATRIMALESLTSRMNLLGKGMLDEGRPEDPFRAIDEVQAVTLDEVNALAAEICDPDRWHRLLLHPSDEV